MMSANVLDLPMTGSVDEGEESLRDQFHTIGPVICYRDPADVRTNRRQSWLIIISFVIAAVGVVGVVYKKISRAQRTGVVMSSNRTLVIDYKKVGAKGVPRVGKDKLQIARMDFVVESYLGYFYP